MLLDDMTRTAQTISHLADAAAALRQSCFSESGIPLPARPMPGPSVGDRPADALAVADVLLRVIEALTNRLGREVS